jgi:hypothetical protein
MPEDEAVAGRVGLSEAIQSLRSELVDAMSHAPNVGLRFQPGPVELTLEVAVTTSGGGEAGIKWWLIEAGVSASRSSVTTQTLKLSLQPVFLDGNGEMLDVLVSGIEEPDQGARDADQELGDRE